MIPVKIIRKTKAAAAPTAAAAQNIDTGLLLPRTLFDDLFQKVLITPPVIDDDGNITTPAVHAIRANYDLFSVGGVSAYGFSGTGSGGGTASVDVKQILTEGVHIATINGVNIFAPKGGASSWAELTGTPPAVSTFQNDLGYLTAAALSGYATTYEVDHKDEQVLASVEQNYVKKTTFETYKGEVTSAIANSEQSVKDWVTKGYVTKEYVDAQKITGYGKSLQAVGKYLRLMDENGDMLSNAITPYAAYTDQLGATGSTTAVSIYGDVTMENGSLAVAGNVNANFNISAGGNLSASGSLSVTGESRFSGAVYLPGQITFFGRDGIYIEADRTTQSEGTAAFIGVHRSFNGDGTIAHVNLDGRVKIAQPMGIRHDPEADISLRVGGTMKTDTLTTGYLMAGNIERPDGYWFASPNGYFGNSSDVYTSFGDGGLELSQATPYIDFHYNKSTADYTSRLIAAEDGVLMIDSATADPALRIGNAYLRYDAINNALYVTGRDGAQVNLYATGGLAAYSAIGSVTQLANLQLTGQLTAASVKANAINMGYNQIYDDGQLYIDIDDALIIGSNATQFDPDGWLYMDSSNEIQLTNDAAIRIGSTADTHRVTDLYADGSYVYITVNGKQYKLYCLSVTAV